MYLYFKLMTVIMPFISFTVIDFISEIIGMMIYLSNNWRIKAIDDNLKAIGAKNYKTEKIFVNMVKNHFELLKMYRMTKNELNRLTEVTQSGDIRKHDKDSFILTGHCGNWDAAPQLVFASGMKSCTIAEYKNVGKEMYKILEMFRGRRGMLVFPLEDISTPIKLRDSYKDGYTPFLVIDRDITKTGVSVKVGSRNLKIPKGPFFFAKKFNSKIVTGAFFRNKSERFRFKIVLDEIGRIESVEEGAQKSIDSLFEIIKTEPEQWFAFDLNWEK